MRTPIASSHGAAGTGQSYTREPVLEVPGVGSRTCLTGRHASGVGFGSGVAVRVVGAPGHGLVEAGFSESSLLMSSGTTLR